MIRIQITVGRAVVGVFTYTVRGQSMIMKLILVDFIGQITSSIWMIRSGIISTVTERCTANLQLHMNDQEGYFVGFEWLKDFSPKGTHFTGFVIRWEDLTAAAYDFFTFWELCRFFGSCAKAVAYVWSLSRTWLTFLSSWNGHQTVAE